jgi:transposase-like protein
MGGGRPNFGVDHVDRIDAPEEDKRRAKIVLQTLTEEISVDEACRRLSIGPTRFHELRKEVLEGAIAGAHPGRPGRPRKEEPSDERKIRRLEGRVKELQEELQLSLLRTELAVALPHVFHPELVPDLEKGGSSPRRGKGRKT